MKQIKISFTIDIKDEHDKEILERIERVIENNISFRAPDVFTGSLAGGEEETNLTFECIGWTWNTEVKP